MAFPPGYKSPGRPKGSKSVKSLLRASEVLADASRHPITELIKIADENETTPGMRRDIWLAILPYIEAPQTEPTPMVPQTSDESVEAAAEVMKHLVALSEPLDDNPPA